MVTAYAVFRPLLVADILVFGLSSVVASISSFCACKDGLEQLICFMVWDKPSFEFRLTSVPRPSIQSTWCMIISHYCSGITVTGLREPNQPVDKATWALTTALPPFKPARIPSFQIKTLKPTWVLNPSYSHYNNDYQEGQISRRISRKDLSTSAAIGHCLQMNEISGR